MSPEIARVVARSDDQHHMAALPDGTKKQPLDGQMSLLLAKLQDRQFDHQEVGVNPMRHRRCQLADRGMSRPETHQLVCKD